MIVSIASKTEVARSSAMFLGPTAEFWRDIRKTIFVMICITFAFIATPHVCNSGWSLVDLVCQPIQITELRWRQDSITSRTRWNRPFFVKYHPYAVRSFLYFFFCFSRVQAEFLSYCFPDVHYYKLILIVLTKFVIHCRIFLHFFHKDSVSAAILKWST